MQVTRATVALTALLCAAVLAGCAQGGAREGAPTDGLPSLAATATTGVIRGVVVDEAIRPLANVAVEARGPDGGSRTATTGADGFFGFAGLAPGTWFLTAEKLAHMPSQQSIEVVAGVDDPPVAKLLLVFIPGEAPFYTEVKMEAFVQCIVPGANLCAIVNLYSCALAGHCEPIVEDTSFIVLHDELVALQRTPDWFQTEVVWQSTQSVSDGLSVRFSPEGGALSEQTDRVAGPSPLVMLVDRTRAEEWGTGTEFGMVYEIFGHMEETSAVGSVGFVVNQRVSFFFHVFYGYAPPDGWQFSIDGSVPQPPQ
jgi:hypothetical protein